MKHALSSHLNVWLALCAGAALAVTLCAQCIRTYVYADAVLVPQQAQREAERQVFDLGAALRNAGIVDPRALGPVIDRTLEAAPERILWMRVLDADGNPVAQSGTPGTALTLPKDWREKLEKHVSVAAQVDTIQGKALVAVLPFRMPRLPPRAGARTSADMRGGYLIELAMPLKAVTGEFDGLRRHLMIGMGTSLALLLSMVVIGLRTPQYLRGKHLEGELQLARRVQSDLQPKPHSMSADLWFAASVVSAGEVGGDFYDVFEVAPGQTAIVLGDVSGKGVAAALLVSVLQGAIRSSASSRQEFACERINRMLCDLTAHARFASLFWGIFDSATGTLRYVNAGHAAPMLIRNGEKRIERLDQGGPVLGLLPSARYSAGSVRIGWADTLVVYSDGINEAANGDEEEFGEDRLREMVSQSPETTPEELCDRIITRVSKFASAGPPPDDRTLMVVRFEPDVREYAVMTMEALAPHA